MNLIAELRRIIRQRPDLEETLRPLLIAPAGCCRKRGRPVHRVHPQRFLATVIRERPELRSTLGYLVERG
jgi:hypothetical protein